MIDNTAKVLAHWQEMGQKTLSCNPSSHKTLAELLVDKDPVMLREGNNGYVYVYFRNHLDDGPKPAA